MRISDWSSDVCSSDLALHRRLADAVVDHLRGDVHRGFAGDELDASPATFAHAPGVMASQPGAAEDIDLEELVPERIVDLEEFPRAIDTEVVDQDVRLRLRRDQRLAAARGTDIGDHPGNIIATGGFAQPPQ